MKQYQKALDDLFNEPLDMMSHEEAKELLQELVNRATPKKLEYDHCPECESEFEYLTSYCSLCGQSIDWDDII